MLESKKIFRRRKEQYNTVMIKKAINMNDNKIIDFSNRLNQTITHGYKKPKKFGKEKKNKRPKVIWINTHEMGWSERVI